MSFMIHYPNETADKQDHPECASIAEVAHKVFGKTLEEVRAMGADIIYLAEEGVAYVEEKLDLGSDQETGGIEEAAGSAEGQAHSGEDAVQGSEETGEVGAESQAGGNAEGSK